MSAEIGHVFRPVSVVGGEAEVADVVPAARGVDVERETDGCRAPPEHAAAATRQTAIVGGRTATEDTEPASCDDRLRPRADIE